MAADRIAEFTLLAQRAALAGSLTKLVLAKPREGAADLRRVTARLVLIQGAPRLSVVHSHRTRDVTAHVAPGETGALVRQALADGFLQAHLLTPTGTVELMVSRKGQATLRHHRTSDAPAAADAAGEDRLADAQADGRETERADATADAQEDAAHAAESPAAAPHDRAKHHLVALERPFLQALGVTDAQQRLVPAMARKWRQINKFVEVLDHALAGVAPDAARPLQVLDFGSGKGYLTFAMHDHLSGTRGLPVQVTGVELRADMVALGNAAAARLGIAGLTFEQGDIRTAPARPVDIMVALHACDTATDHAIHAGVRAGAQVIVCSPCCHRELRPQLLAPHPLRPILRHGIHLGQQAEMLTDSLRALLLEACGYETQVFEFVALEHTQKNKMILAVKRPRAGAAEAAWAQVRALKDFYGVRDQCLEALLRADGRGVPVAEPA
jgi:SAM-dependent methyltransferase